MLISNKPKLRKFNLNNFIKENHPTMGLIAGTILFISAAYSIFNSPKEMRAGMLILPTEVVRRLSDLEEKFANIELTVSKIEKQCFIKPKIQKKRKIR